MAQLGSGISSNNQSSLVRHPLWTWFIWVYTKNWLHLHWKITPCQSMRTWETMINARTSSKSYINLSLIQRSIQVYIYISLNIYIYKYIEGKPFGNSIVSLQLQSYRLLWNVAQNLSPAPWRGSTEAGRLTLDTMQDLFSCFVFLFNGD